MTHNPQLLEQFLRLSVTAWALYESIDQRTDIVSAQIAMSMWDAIDRRARTYGKDFFRDETWGFGLTAEELLEVVCVTKTF